MASKPTIPSILSKIAVPKERVISTGQGCWNCLHWRRESAVGVWTQLRQRDLARAAEIALGSPDGEANQQVVNIRRMVNDIDHLVATKHMAPCSGGGETANGEPVGDLVAHAFLCHKWTGVQGSSLAREGKTDRLPEEVAERIDGPKPSRKIN